MLAKPVQKESPIHASQTLADISGNIGAWGIKFGGFEPPN